MKSAFNGVKVFGATMVAQRAALGEAVTAWIEDARRNRRGFEVVDIVVTQSSDDAFHLISVTVFYNESTGGAATKGKKPRD